MIERSVTITITGDERQILQDVYDVENLKKWWMFLRDVEVKNEEEYIARFRVFMNFKFDMRRIIGLNMVVHEGKMKFPRAFFRFTVEVYPRRQGDVDVVVKGEYSGPLEKLAGIPMEVFLKNFAKNLEEKYKGGTSQLTVKQILEYQLEASKEYKGEIIVTVNDCKIVVKGGEIVSAECNGVKGVDAIERVLQEKSAKVKVEYN